MTGAGTYLMPHMDLGKAVEFDETDKTVCSADVPGVWSVVCLAQCAWPMAILSLVDKPCAH